jgi:phosphate transport system regulatory protein PhoU
MKEREIENECLKLMLQQQPVAKDLRLISSAIKMITDMERIGDQAADIAEIICFANLSAHISRPAPDRHVPGDGQNGDESIDAFVRRDLELARKVRGDDDIVDALFRDVRSDVIASVTNKTGKGEEAVDIIMIAKYFERIGDHATNIANGLNSRSREIILFGATYDLLCGRRQIHSRPGRLQPSKTRLRCAGFRRRKNAACGGSEDAASLFCLTSCCRRPTAFPY